MLDFYRFRAAPNNALKRTKRVSSLYSSHQSAESFHVTASTSHSVPPLSCAASSARPGPLARLVHVCWLLGITTLVSFSGFLRDLVLGWQMGPGIRLDTFLLGTGAPLFVAGCAGAAFNLLCVPQLQTWAATHPRDEAAALERVLFWQYVRWVSIAFVTLLVLAPLLEVLLRTGFRYEKTLLTMKVAMATILPAWCFSLSQAALTLLQRDGKRPLLLLTNTGMPAGVALAALASFSLSHVVFGLALGAALQLGILLKVLHREGHDQLFKGALLFKAPAPQVKATALLALGSVICLSLPGLLELSYSGLLGLAGTSRYSYGVKVPGALCAIVGSALSWKLLARFSQAAAEQQWQTLRHDWARALLGLTLAASSVAVIGHFCSPLIVKALFMRGNFAEADAEVAISVQKWAFWLFPLILMSLTGQRLLAALRSPRALFAGSMAGLVFCSIAGVLLTSHRGYVGLIWSMLLTHVVFALSFNGLGFWLLNKKQQEV